MTREGAERIADEARAALRTAISKIKKLDADGWDCRLWSGPPALTYTLLTVDSELELKVTKTLEDEL